MLTTILIIVGIVIFAGSYWLMRRSVLRDEPASRQRLERRREAWRAGGSVGPAPSHSTAAAAVVAEVATEAAEVATEAAEVATEAEAAEAEVAEAEATERAGAARSELPTLGTWPTDCGGAGF